MGYLQFLETLGRIVANPGVSTLGGAARHVLWQFRRHVHVYPYRVVLTERSCLLVTRSEAANGCAALAWSQRLYDFNNMHFLVDVLARSGRLATVFDIGANIGVYSLLASESAGVRVFAFEPHPTTAAMLRDNIAANERRNVVVVERAISSGEAEVTISDDPGGPENRVLKAASGVAGRRVAASSVAKICSEYAVIPDVVKLDVEGHEPEVLRGMTGMIDQVSLVLLEENAPREVLREWLSASSFDGPLYVDFRARQLRRRRVSAKEDALYVNLRFLPDLASLGYGVEGGQTP